MLQNPDSQTHQKLSSVWPASCTSRVCLLLFAFHGLDSARRNTKHNSPPHLPQIWCLFFTPLPRLMGSKYHYYQYRHLHNTSRGVEWLCWV